MEGKRVRRSSENKIISEFPNELKVNVEDPIKEVGKRQIHLIKQQTNIVRQRANDKCQQLKKYVNNVEDDIRGRFIAIQSVWDGRVFKFSDLPDWMKDNEYITDGHRPQITSLKSCFKSIFSIHAETGNIWTHLVGALIFLGLIIFYLQRPADDFIEPVQEKAVVVTFYVSAFLCLSFSTVFHTLGCNSEDTCLFCGRLDYTGIAILITGSFLPWVYYSFYCETQTQINYIVTIFILGTICTVVSLFKSFALPKYRVLRGVLFLVFGLCGVAPCVHSTIQNGAEHSFSDGQIQNLILMGALYIIGVVFFTTRFPESVWPGKFNLVFHSHQLFHILVVSAALVQVWACHNLQQYRRARGDSCQAQES